MEIYNILDTLDMSRLISRSEVRQVGVVEFWEHVSAGILLHIDTDIDIDINIDIDIDIDIDMNILH